MTTTSLGSYFWKNLVLYSSFNGIHCNSYSTGGHNTVIYMNKIQCTSNTTDNYNCMGCGRSTSSTAMLFPTEQYTVLDHTGTHFYNRLFEWSNIKSFGISVTSKVLPLATCSRGLKMAWRFCGRCRAARCVCSVRRRKQCMTARVSRTVQDIPHWSRLVCFTHLTQEWTNL